MMRLDKSVGAGVHLTMVASALCVALCASAAWASAGDLKRIDQELAGLAKRLKTLVDEHSDPSKLDRTRPFRERLADAEILFLLGDHARASLLLFDLVESKHNRDKRLHAKAVYYLAESQYQIGNDLAARTYFDQLVQQHDKQRLTDAIKRLIQLADRMAYWEGLDSRVNILRKRGRLPPAIAYIHAKSLLRQSAFTEVAAAIADVPAQHPLYAKTQYLLAVALVQQGKLADSRKVFDQLTRIKDKYDDAAKVRDLAAMNRARIYMDEGALSKSIDAYQYIRRDSDQFEESLYELTWLHVRAAAAAEDQELRTSEYVKALKALEILLVSAEQSTLMAPEARLLLGNIKLRLGRYEQATDAFDEVVQTYAPVRDRLSTLAGEVTDPVAYYDQVAARSKTGGAVLPPLAVKWAAEQEELKQALEVVTDLDKSQSWIDESMAIIDKLLALLDSKERQQFVPALQDAEAHRLELANTLIALSKRLLAAERSVVQKNLDSGQATALAQVLAERQRLEPAYRKLPQNRKDYEGRRNSMRDRMAAAQKNAFQLRWGVEELRRNLEGMRQYLAQNPQSMSARNEAEYRSQIDRYEVEIAGFETEQRQLESDVIKQRGLIGISTQAEADEDELRARYAATLEREQAILSTGADGAGSEALKQIADVKRLRRLVGTYRAETEAFGGRLATMVADKALLIKAELLKEQSAIESYGRAINEERESAKHVVGEIAVDSLQTVEKTFQQIVLRGDVGIVDVAWALKEDQTRVINRRVSEQRRELQVIDKQFSEVLSDD